MPVKETWCLCVVVASGSHPREILHGALGDRGGALGDGGGALGDRGGPWETGEGSADPVSAGSFCDSLSPLLSSSSLPHPS